MGRRPGRRYSRSLFGLVSLIIYLHKNVWRNLELHFLCVCVFFQHKRSGVCFSPFFRSEVLAAALEDDDISYRFSLFA